MKLKLFYFIIILIFILLSVNCYEQTIIIDNDRLSGKMSFQVQLFDDFENFLSYQINKSHLDKISILFNQNILQSELQKNDENNLYNYSLQNDDFSKNSRTEITFNNLEDLPQSLPSAYFPLIITKKSNQYSVKMVLNLRDYINKSQMTLSAEEMKLIEDYASMIKMKFVFKIYKPITRINQGRLSNDRTELVYETTLAEMLTSKSQNEIEFSFSY